MRANIALVSILAAGLLVSAGPATSETAAAGSKPGLPEEVAGGVIVDLADGDRFKVTVSRDYRTVWGSRYDAATRSWSERNVVLRKKNLFCGEVDARAAGTSVAVIAECDENSYAEDQAPTSSHALYSPDTLNWRAFELPGEAYEEPGISPNGANAIWPMHQQWVTWTSAGFQVVRRALPGQEYTVTGTISDTGDSSVLYGGAEDSSGDCAIGVLTLSSAGVETRQVLAVENACADSSLTNVDALAVQFGDPSSPHSVLPITRHDTTSPWVAGIAPEDAPGLVRHRGRGAAATRFATSPGLPFVAVGSPDQQTFTAQVYDPTAQRWSEPRPIGSGIAGCTWGDNYSDLQLDVIALELRCGKRERVLVSTDTEVWHDVGLNRSPVGVSPDGQYVAASNQTRTLIFSRERGLVRLPLPTRARCDVIQPVSPDTAVRLSTTRRTTGWPSVLHESTATGWRRTDTAFPRLRVGTDRCTGVDVELYQLPARYSFSGPRSQLSLTVTADGDGWKVRRPVY